MRRNLVPPILPGDAVTIQSYSAHGDHFIAIQCEAIVIGTGKGSKINRLKYTHALLNCIPKNHFAYTGEESLARWNHVQLVSWPEIVAVRY